MDKKRSSRFRYSLRYGIAAAVLIALLASVFWPREGHVVTLGYGTFKQILQAPGAQFTKLHVGTTTITGEVTFPDRVSGETASGKPMAFRVSRTGVENDATLYPLLNARVPSFQGQGERTATAVFVEVL